MGMKLMDEIDFCKVIFDPSEKVKAVIIFIINI